MTSLDRRLDVLVTQHLSKCHGRPAADRHTQRGKVSVAKSAVPLHVTATKQLSALPVSGWADLSAVISRFPHDFAEKLSTHPNQLSAMQRSLPLLLLPDPEYRKPLDVSVIKAGEISFTPRPPLPPPPPSVHQSTSFSHPLCFANRFKLIDNTDKTKRVQDK